MKSGAAAMALILSGCGTVPPVPWARGPEMSQSACTASCNAHYDQCPQIFANFPERAAVECPAEHNQCLKACEDGEKPGRTAAAPRVAAADPPPASVPPAQVAASPARTVASKEARLRELKHFYDEGLITDDVYRDRQKAILAEP
jgi:hypothetical protein